jgi:hypothetical protein
VKSEYKGKTLRQEGKALRQAVVDFRQLLVCGSFTLWVRSDGWSSHVLGIKLNLEVFENLLVTNVSLCIKEFITNKHKTKFIYSHKGVHYNMFRLFLLNIHVMFSVRYALQSKKPN